MKILKAVINFIMDGLETIVFVSSIYIVIYLYLFCPTQVIGSSMEPTLQSGDRLIMSKISYRLGEIKRDDVVVIKSPKNPDVDYIKRVIALPGDVIEIKSGGVFINNVFVQENFVSSQTNIWENGFVKEGVPYGVPVGFVFVMGDNRPRSSDSREFGPVPISSIEGQAVLRYFPPNKISLFKNINN